MNQFANRNNKTLLKFVIANVNYTKKNIAIFGHSIRYGATLDLMKVRGISEDDIKDSLIKGDLRHKIDNKDIKVMISNIHLITFDPNFKAFLNANNMVVGTAVSGNLVITTGNAGIYNCDVSVNIGDVVYLSSPDLIDKADADDILKQPLIGIVQSKNSLIEAIVLYTGELTGFVGLIPGSTYFLSKISGQFTTDPPLDEGAIVQKVGFAKNSTTLVVLIDRDYIVN